MKHRKHTYFVLALAVALGASAIGVHVVRSRLPEPAAASVPLTATVFPEEQYLASGSTMELQGTVTQGGAALPTVLLPSADGIVVDEKNGACIDASHTEDGYLMIRYTGSATTKLMVLITGPSKTQYRYVLNQNQVYDTFPLSDGSGSYQVGVYRNVSGTKYAAIHTTTLQVALKNEFAPFLLPNQYVNYTAESKTVAKAAELTRGCKTGLEKVEKVYDFVVTHFHYDYEKAATVQSGYLPNVDELLSSQTGICFDYAAVMAAMLRSQNIPTKLVVGYTGSVYHAWLSVYTEETGWVESVIFFNGKEWKRMDPTFASTANSSKQIMEYINDPNNYQAKYLY